MHRRNLDKQIITGTAAELTADTTIYSVNFELSPTDTADVGKHKLCNDIHTYAQLPFIEDGGGVGTTYTADETSLVLTGTVFSEKDGGTTNAKLADMQPGTIKGKFTPGVGAPEDGNASDVKTVLVLSNVDDTSDANKPVSSDQATAIALKIAPFLNGLAVSGRVLDVRTATIAGGVGIATIDLSAYSAVTLLSATCTNGLAFPGVINDPTLAAFKVAFNELDGATPVVDGSTVVITFLATPV